MIPRRCQSHLLGWFALECPGKGLTGFQFQPKTEDEFCNRHFCVPCRCPARVRLLQEALAPVNCLGEDRQGKAPSTIVYLNEDVRCSFRFREVKQLRVTSSTPEIHSNRTS